MTYDGAKTHPLVVVAATTVILTCLVAIGVMTGILPSGFHKDRAPESAMSAASGVESPAVNGRENHLVGEEPSPPRAQAPQARLRADERTDTTSAPPAPLGATGSAASERVAGAAPAPAACDHCGTVTSVRAVRQQGEAGLLGPAAGGLVGGAVGSQIGHGSGKTIAMIVGAAGGAAAGTEIERRYKSTTHYVVGVRLNNGTRRTFTYQAAPGVQTGDRIRVVNGKLVRD